MEYWVFAIAEAVSVALSVTVGLVTYQPCRPSGAAGLVVSVVVGGVVSTTVTVKCDEPVLPCASVFEQVTVVEPFANVERGGAQVELPSPSTRSCDAGGENVTAPAGESSSPRRP